MFNCLLSILFILIGANADLDSNSTYVDLKVNNRTQIDCPDGSLIDYPSRKNVALFQTF